MKKLLLSFAAMSAMLSAQAQLTLVQDIHPTGSADPCAILEMNGKIYFNANDGTNGRELWSLDPGTNVAQMVYNIGPGSANGLNIAYSDNNATACVLNGKLYFGANDGTNGIELWMYDGVNSPTMIADIYAGALSSNPSNFLVYNNKIYFNARNAAVGDELFVYDPTTNIAQAISDIETGSTGSYPQKITAYNNKFYFRAITAATGSELFVYDPNTNATTLVHDISAGAPNSDPKDLMVAGNKLYFTAFNNTYGRELYSYTGTGLPVRLTDLNPGIGDGVSTIAGELFNGKIYMSADNGATSVELFSFDITNNTAQLVYDIEPGLLTSYPGPYVNYANKLYFAASNSANGSELWKYDGVTPPTMVQDLNPGLSSATPLLMTVINNTMYLNAQNSDGNYELFKLYDAAVSVKSIANEMSVSVYPVPAIEAVHIAFTLTDAASIATQVYDITGRMVYATEMMDHKSGANEITIPCSSFAAGAYQYTLTGKDGSVLATGKMIKQ
jgi:ELWxxDGT repeat protein